MNKKDYIFCPRCKNTLVEKKKDNELVKVCESCGFIFWNKPKPVVSIIIHQNKKVLMLQRSNNPFKDFWVLPGGFMSINDTPQQALEKEVKEETGLEPEIQGLVGVYRIDNDPRGIHIDIIFHGTGSGTVKLGSEHTAWDYFSLRDFPKEIAYKHREAINDWYNKSND